MTEYITQTEIYRIDFNLLNLRGTGEDEDDQTATSDAINDWRNNWNNIKKGTSSWRYSKTTAEQMQDIIFNVENKEKKILPRIIDCFAESRDNDLEEICSYVIARLGGDFCTSEEVTAIIILNDDKFILEGDGVELISAAKRAKPNSDSSENDSGSSDKSTCS